MTPIRRGGAASSRDDGVDPVIVEVIRHELLGLTEEMNLTMRHTARSVAAKETNDFSSALLDAEGTVIAQAVPYGLSVFNQGVPYVIAKFEGRFQAGDAFLTNDPYQGVSHLPDVLVVMPILSAGKLVAFSATYQHHTDMGGRFPGGFGTESHQLYEEGLRLPIVPFYRGGVPDDATHDMIAANVRAPDDVLGDLEANVAACRRGAAGFGRLLDRYGQTSVRLACAHYLARSEQCMRDAIRALPDGRYQVQSRVDDGRNTSFDLSMALIVEDDSLTVDFSGSARQLDTAWNIPPGLVWQPILGNLLGLLGGREPMVNTGLLRPVKVIAPEGTVVNPTFPAAVASRAQGLLAIGDMMLAALSLADPITVPATGDGGPTVLVYSPAPDGGAPPDVVTDIWHGGWGARANSDGIDGVVALWMNGFRTSSGELLEQQAPIRLEGFGFVPDTGGAGRFRGTVSVFRRFRFGRKGRVMLRTCRAIGAAPGLAGGGAGGEFHASLFRDGIETPLPQQSVIDMEVREGDVIEHVMPGGGGFGPAASRSPALVWADVLDGKVSLGAATDIYGYQAEKSHN